MPKRADLKPARGTTLIETVIALFLLGLATLLVASLFQSGLRRSRLSEKEALARIVAENALVDLRAWSADGGFRQISDLGAKDGLAFPDPDYPDFQVRYSLQPTTLSTASTSLEAVYPPAQRREMSQSAALARVEVSWTAGGGQKTLALESLIPESPREIERVEVIGVGGGTVSKDGSVTVRARAYDTDGQAIEDLVLDWWLEPITGKGTLEPQRARPEATLHHYDRDQFGSTTHYPGRCRVAVRAVYDGKEVTGYSGEIVLAP